MVRSSLSSLALVVPTPVDSSDAIREAAVRFLRVHPLRAADALQLAAAFIAAERRPPSLEVVTLDDRLAVAARKEGFALIDVPSSESRVSSPAGAAGGGGSHPDVTER